MAPLFFSSSIPSLSVPLCNNYPSYAQITKISRAGEVEQQEQRLQVILQRRPIINSRPHKIKLSDKHTNNLQKHGIEVLDLMRLVEYGKLE